MVILVAVLWGSAYPIVRYLVAGGVDPYLIVSMRVLLTFFATSILVLCSRQQLHFPVYRKNFFPYFLISLTGTVGFLAFMTLGLEFSTATKSSIIIGSNPILVVILSRLFLKESLGFRKLIGVLMAIVGIFFAVAGGELLSGRSLQFALPDCILLLGAVLWATYTILLRQYGHYFNYIESCFWMFGGGAILTLPLFIPRVHLLASLTGEQWFWLVFCGLIPGGLCYFLWSRGLNVLGASICSICASFMPASSVLLAAIFLHEPLVWTQLVGLVFVISGVLLGVIKSHLPVNYESGISLNGDPGREK